MRKGVRELVHGRLTREMVCRRGERPIRALAKRRTRGMKLGALVRDFVGRADSGRAGIIVVEFPGGERAVGARAAANLDHAGGPEVRPGEFFLACPDELDGLPRRFREPRRLDGRIARMLAAVRRSGIGHDDTHPVLGNPKRFGKLQAHAERPLRARPDGEFPAAPLRHRSARLERGVLDVGDGVGLLEPRFGGL